MVEALKPRESRPIIAFLFGAIAGLTNSHQLKEATTFEYEIPVQNQGQPRKVHIRVYPSDKVETFIINVRDWPHEALFRLGPGDPLKTYPNAFVRPKEKVNTGISSDPEREMTLEEASNYVLLLKILKSLIPTRQLASSP
ncbi:MAG: hypothetical protein HYW62_04680 [Candidatus Levybacteria bacterium]|nr:hypothetical protein [Candidatus Levybacteria bacterium]